MLLRSGSTALFLLTALGAPATGLAAQPERFTVDHVFELEYAAAPAVSPDGDRVVYVRTRMDRRRDRPVGELWIVEEDGAPQPLVTGPGSYGAPRFSPDGSRLAYVASGEGPPALMVRWLGTDRAFRVADLEHAPRDLAWSPDGTQLAFTLFVPGEPLDLDAKEARRPEGADWAPAVKVIDDVVYRFDGRGFLQEGAEHVHVVPASGGTPRALTAGEHGFSDPAWSADGTTLYVVGNDAPDPELDPIESELYAVDLASGAWTRLTERDGPDHSPRVSPDGRRLAWLGYDDERLAYQQEELWVRELPDGAPRALTLAYDQDLGELAWHPDGRALLALATVRGETHLVRIDLEGRVRTLARDVGGLSLGRPYGSGAYAVGGGRRATVAYTQAGPDRPADLAVLRGDREPETVTDLNGDVLGRLALARLETLTVPSQHDDLPVDAWVAFPPDFEADGSAPMILEIHGGPFAMYGPTFAAEIQRYAAEGYVVVYANPRGSTGYGEAFALEIDRAYPGHDHDDLMSVVDAVVQRNWVDPERLFVTGGSGGGVLSAYATGRTDRFAAAAVIKPVINWFTMALAADIGPFVRRHWIREDPWENPQFYFERSPISVVGNVTTPTLVMVGEEDWRTPSWEAEQWYAALKLRKVEAAYVRVPGASHGIASRPSHLVAKTEHILGWFARHDPAKAGEAGE